MDPTQVQWHIEILEEGYFVDAVCASGRPIGFRYHGYEPVDITPKGEPLVVEDIARPLKPLADANKATVEGKSSWKGGEDVLGASVSLQLTTSPLNSATGGYEGVRGTYSSVSLTATSGDFQANGLTPAEHSLYADVPGTFRSSRG